MTYSHHTSKIKQRGAAALLTILMIGAAVLIMAYSTSLLSIGELDLGYTHQKAGAAFAVADGCMEETLRRIRLDTNYGIGVGDINLSVPGGSCIITVTDTGGGTRDIVVVGISGDYHKRIQVTLTLTGNVITIDSWQEITG